MQNAEQVIANYQTLLGASNYELATARLLAQQLSQELANAQAEIARLKETGARKSHGNNAKKK